MKADDVTQVSESRTTLGYVVLYVFAAESPVHPILTPVLEEISRLMQLTARRAPHSLFFKIRLDDLAEEQQEAWNCTWHATIDLQGSAFSCVLEWSASAEDRCLHKYMPPDPPEEGLIKQMMASRVLPDREQVIF